MPAHEDLLRRMQESKAGWGEDDLHAIYTGFGFKFRAGKKHNVYSHARFPELRATVSRQKSLPTGYVQTALKLIRRLQELEGSGGTP